MMDFSKSKFDIVGKAKLWYIISGIIIVAGILGMIWNMATAAHGERFPLIRGIDFAGGSILEYEFQNWDPSTDTADFASQVREMVDGYTTRSSQVQTIPLEADPDEGRDTPGLLLQIRADSSLIENQEAQDNLYREIVDLGGECTLEKAEEVSAVIGAELTRNAITGVMIGLVLILIYVTIRLSLDFAVFAIVALVHDVLILCGVFAIFQIEINSPFVAVLLTVVGYSINDTIVIYDRIRENMKVKRHLPFDRIVNQSLLETMARSINTSFTTLLAILALLIFGGATLQTFMLGLGVGVLTGTYSSIFVASVMLVTWRLRSKGLKITDDDLGIKADATDLIHEDPDADLMDDYNAGEAPEQIVVDKPKSTKKKRRKRRY